METKSIFDSETVVSDIYKYSLGDSETNLTRFVTNRL